MLANYTTFYQFFRPLNKDSISGTRSSEFRKYDSNKCENDATLICKTIV